MKWLVCFDISDNKKRNKVVEYLEEYGVRVQKSVFEIELNSNSLNKLKTRLDSTIEKDDSVRFYPVNVNQIDKIIVLGVKISPFELSGIKFL